MPPFPDTTRQSGLAKRSLDVMRAVTLAAAPAAAAAAARAVRARIMGRVRDQLRVRALLSGDVVGAIDGADAVAGGGSVEIRARAHRRPRIARQGRILCDRDPGAADLLFQRVDHLLPVVAPCVDRP